MDITHEGDKCIIKNGHYCFEAKLTNLKVRNFKPYYLLMADEGVYYIFMHRFVLLGDIRRDIQNLLWLDNGFVLIMENEDEFTFSMHGILTKSMKKISGDLLYTKTQ